MDKWYVGQIVEHTAFKGFLMKVIELHSDGFPSIAIDCDQDGKIGNLEAREITKRHHIKPFVIRDITGTR